MSPEFESQWERVESNSHGDMISTVFRNRQDSKFSMIISRADRPRQRLDRVQILATATYDIGD